MNWPWWKLETPVSQNSQKKEKNWGGICPPDKCTVLGVVNVRYMGVANVRLANLPTLKTDRIGLPALTLFIMRNLTKDITVTSITRGIISEILVLHLWPKTDQGKRIGLAMTVLIFFLYAAP